MTSNVSFCVSFVTLFLPSIIEMGRLICNLHSLTRQSRYLHPTYEHLACFLDAEEERRKPAPLSTNQPLTDCGNQRPISKLQNPPILKTRKSPQKSSSWMRDDPFPVCMFIGLVAMLNFRGVDSRSCKPGTGGTRLTLAKFPLGTAAYLS